MGRKRKHNKHLPKGVTFEHGAYYYRGKDRKRVHLGRVLADALAEWAELIEPPAGDIRTLRDAFERYKLEVIPRKAEKTRRNQLYMFPVLEKVFGSVRPAVIKPRHGYAFLSRRSKAIQREVSKRAKEKGLPPPKDLDRRGLTQAVKEFNLLSHVMTKCIEWGVIDHHPFVKQVRKDEYTAPARTRYATDEEFAAVYELANERMQIAMDLALLTGLRRAGILALNLDDDTDAGLVSETPGKTTKPLLFEWTPELRAVVDRARRLTPRVRRALLCTRTGDRYTADGFSANWQRLMRRALEEGKISKRFTFNDLRAKSATDTESLSEASERLGHETKTTTRRVYIRKPAKVQPLIRQRERE